MTSTLDKLLYRFRCASVVGTSVLVVDVVVVDVMDIVVTGVGGTSVGASVGNGVSAGVRA